MPSNMPLLYLKGIPFGKKGKFSFLNDPEL